MEKILSAEELYYNQLHKQTGKIMNNFEIAENYAKYLLKKQAEFIKSDLIGKFGFTDELIDKASNEFIKNIEL